MSKLLTNTSWCVVLGFVMALGCVMDASPARADDDKGYVVFEYTTQENLRPDHVPAQGAIVDTVSCTLARDEYEPVQIGVHASADRLTNIRVTVESDLEMTVYHRIDPDVPLTSPLEGYAALWSHAKATRVLGYQPQYTWRESDFGVWLDGRTDT